MPSLEDNDLNATEVQPRWHKEEMAHTCCHFPPALNLLKASRAALLHKEHEKLIDELVQPSYAQRYGPVYGRLVQKSAPRYGSKLSSGVSSVVRLSMGCSAIASTREKSVVSRPLPITSGASSREAWGSEGAAQALGHARASSTPNAYRSIRRVASVTASPTRMRGSRRSEAPLSCAAKRSGDSHQ